MRVSQPDHQSNPLYKKDLLPSIIELSGLSREQASLGLNSMLKAIQQGLKEKHKVRITGFGTFRITQRPIRKGHNLHTGQTLIIPATLYPIFRTGKMLRGWES